MTIKALLLGSAAALVAVSGARAADAVVIPEPEAVEYVRVCDAAGAGYFYIPGGETCLQIGGYVQFEVATNSALDGFDYTNESVLDFRSWTDSEFGAVETYIKIQGGDRNFIRVDQATLSIGGLSMGWGASLYDFSATGAADALVNTGEDETNMIMYTADFSGGSFDIQISDDNDLDYTPDLLAKLTFSAGAAQFQFGGVYNESANAYGLKAVGTFGGFGAVVQYSSRVGFDYMGTNQWIVGANYGFDATEKLNLNLGVAYGFQGLGVAENWVVGTEAKYKLTDTFEVSGRARVADNSAWDARVRFKASF